MRRKYGGNGHFLLACRPFLFYNSSRVNLEGESFMNIATLGSGYINAQSDLLVLAVKKPEAKKKEKGKEKKKEIIKQFSSPFLPAGVCSALLERMQRQEFKAGHLESTLINFSPEPRFKAILIVGWDGKKKGAYDVCAAYRKLGSIVYEGAEKLRLRKICLAADELELKESANAAAFLEGLCLAAYNFDRYKSEKEPAFAGIDEICFAARYKFPSRAHEEAHVFCEATLMARDLVNTPARDCTPAFMVEKCREIARKGRLQIKVFDRQQLEKMEANLFLSVAQGSKEPPYLVKMTYRPSGRPAKVISLVGKGITFDSGGLSLKTGSHMENMKSDMSGAAAVMGAMQAVAALKPKAEVRAYIPLTENMVDGSGSRPGDVVKGLSGKSVEIMNTDAEGRLILADALHLACKDKCDAVIDLATLTGACIVALGTDFAALFSDDNKLIQGIEEAAALAGERVWRLPLADEYKELIKSPIADIKNTGGGWGGSITAALFLKEFVSETAWAHIDIAGPAFVDSAKGHIKKGATGFGVRTLARFLCQRR